MLSTFMAVIVTVSGFFPRLLPPLGAGFTRYGVVLSPTVTWEQTSIQEPNVLVENGVWKMWAKGGWATTAMGYYTSTDGLSWTPYAGNPVLGNGVGGTANKISQPTIVPPALGDGTNYICYFNDLGDVNPNTPRYATSPDGITWTVGGSGSFITNPGAITQWGNTKVWREGASWYMLIDARIGGVFQELYATSSNGLSWTIGNGSSPLTSLQVSGGDNYGSPEVLLIPKISGTYHLWYLDGAGSTSDIYHATSTDRITWTRSPGTPVLTHTGSGNEVDQASDPSVVVAGSVGYLYYAGVDNTAHTGVILLATGTAAP